ncbi:MAG: glutaminase A [Akkermansiaceae bacterium]|nr:glutaminase A [Verrucomicrobiales bacterium]
MNLPHSSTPSPVLRLLEQIHRDCSGMNDGQVATYIPELGKANPAWFGICIVTQSGSVYEVGDTRQEFTIQSISKPFVYGLALEDNSRIEVLKKVGVEPTGDVFNSISLEPNTGRPRNPMINAGAIATAGMIAGRSPQARLKRVLETFSLFAGRELALDETVYRSESDTGHRNRAIGHMLRNFNILTSDPMAVTELYFQQCSISVHCRDLAVMAATLANRGINPLTGKQALRGEYVESVLSVMETCGMYDYAGEWIYNVGMPAKSGVSGGVIAVLPGQLGIGVFSPLLDAHGNSVRGVKVCQELSRLLDLHLLNRPGVGKLIVRQKFNGADFNSSRVRTPVENRTLRETGRRIQVWQLQGNLMFSTTEVAIRDIVENMADAEFLLLDFKRVLTLNECACRLFCQLLLETSTLGKHLYFIQVQPLPLLRRYMRIKLGAQFEKTFHVFADIDRALEWCEDRLLETSLPLPAKAEAVTLENFPLLADLSVAERDALLPLLTSRLYQTGDVIINAGDKAGELFLLRTGRASVLLKPASGETTRLATFSAGMTFGEMAMIDGAPRSAMIVADSEVECNLLTLEDFQRLDESHPGLKIKLLRNMCLDLCSKLRKANRELSVLG